MGRSTVANIIKDVCKYIWEILQPIYMPTPTEEVWNLVEIGYRQQWHFPNCLGSIDGKHVTVKCPSKSGSLYYCYKQKFSIVLLAIVDPYYKFIAIDVGSYGKDSDSRIFENSTFYQRLVNNQLNLPQPKPFPGCTNPMPHVFIGDEGFALKPYLMRPFPREQAERDREKAVFNKRLSTARRVVENAFGILAHKWRVFFRPFEIDINSTVTVVKAACCLHNYLRIKNQILATESEEAQRQLPLIAAFQPSRIDNRRSNTVAFDIRNNFMAYFNNQNCM